MRIVLEGIQAIGFHGVLTSERHDGQPFIIDVTLKLPEPAVDDIAATVDYASVAEAVVSQVSGPPVRLIETLARRIADSLLANWPVLHCVTVTVHKPQSPINVPFRDVSCRLTRSSGDPISFTLSLGSNLGDSRVILLGAVEALRKTPGVTVNAISDVYRTSPVEVSDEYQPDYLNLVLLGTTTLSAHGLLQCASDIETRFNRQRPYSHAPRTLDIDLICVGDAFIDNPELILPHPRAYQRSFVLVPWAEIAPEAVLPQGSVQDLAAQAGMAGITRLGALC